jgi:hypothetical protein
MSLLDSIISANFRNEKGGCVVSFPGDQRHRGYLLKSQADERKVRSFLKMFFCAHLSILLLGMLLASGWSHDLIYALGRPALHVFRSMAISAGVYLLVAGLPYFLLWRSYKKAFVSFVSPEDAVVISGRRTGGRLYILVVAGLIILGMGVLLAVAVSHKP